MATSRDDGSAKKRSRTWRVVRALVSLAVVVGIFAGVIPKMADYSSVFRTIGEMTSLEIGVLVAAMVFNLFTYWWQMMACMPGLRFLQAAVNNQTGTSIANTIPGGGFLAVGVTTAMYRSWGFTFADIALVTGVTGVWNLFLKLGLPIIALGLLAATGGATASLLVAALIGLAVLVLAVALFALALWRERFAEAIGDGLGRVVSRVLTLFGRPAVTGWGRAAVRFRSQIIGLVSSRWPIITLTTLVSHLTLFAVLLISLRQVGVSEQEVSWAEALAVFAFGRLVSAIPITPGGLGFVEAALIKGLELAGGPVNVVAAAVLVFRLLTYGVQIPLGGLTYLIWKRNRSWRRTPADETEAERRLRAATT
jgi:putative heme transporter